MMNWAAKIGIIWIVVFFATKKRNPERFLFLFWVLINKY